MTSVLSVEGVSKTFRPATSAVEEFVRRLSGRQQSGLVRAVDEVSLTVRKGEVLGLVGESGCGKSTLGRLMAGIHAPTMGRVVFAGEPLMKGAAKATTRIQTVFQDPFASLDPRFRIGATIAEGPIAHGLVQKSAAKAYVEEWLAKVGLPPDAAERFPHEFSGGQRQRVAIARALAMRPDVLICDEPVASLDVSIQAQIVNLFLSLRRELALTMIFISHDLGVVRHVSDRIAVMYLGRIVELGDADEVYRRPLHPYSKALLDSVPKLIVDPSQKADFKTIEGDLPSPLSPPSGCHFHKRCAFAEERCGREVPKLTGRLSKAACFLPLSYHFLD